MNTSKKISVNFSSLVGLKAELLRKQTEIKEAKAKEDGQPKVTKPKTRTKKVKKKVSKEPLYTEIEDVATLKKSRIMLEAKSMLYEKLKKCGGGGIGDETHSYLVDFANKSDESEDEVYRDESYDDANSDPEDDWVEYQDCFGRTRKCLRRDLPKMRERDDLVKREIAKEPPQEEVAAENTSAPVYPTVEKEPEIETMRKKWEEQMRRLVDKTDIHYQDVLFDEARSHGVGYYAFSQNEEERAKQQENLAKLRKETERRQKESQEIRESKSKMELNRLRAAMIRRRVRSGLSAELTEEEEEELRAKVKSQNSSETPEEETSPEAMEAAANKAESQDGGGDNSLVRVEDKIKAFGQLLGKRPKWHEMSQEEWVYKRRKDRLGEFAPVYENFRRGDCIADTRDTRITTRDDDEKDPLRIHSKAPEPTDVWETQGPLNVDEDHGKETPEEGKTEETTKEDSSKREDDLDTNETVADDNDEDIVGPLPPRTFINSFVPQPMNFVPGTPITFERSAPPPSIINFAIPPPTAVPPLPKIANCLEPETDVLVDETEDSTDSEDSVVIGPVPPPSINDCSIRPVNSCGPRLIDNDHISALADIPLPASVQFPPTQNYTVDPASINETDILNESPASSTTNLDIEKIEAGLKYLRQKFDDTRQTS